LRKSTNLLRNWRSASRSRNKAAELCRDFGA
jgi:hypothetical protein